MTTLRVGLCLDPAAVEIPGALRRLEETDFLVFPEMVDGGYAGLKAGALPHHRGDSLLRRFAGYSQGIARYCIAGSVFLHDPPPATSNTSLVYHRGQLIHRYDKIHLFRPSGDHRYFRPGTHIRTFTAILPAGRIRCGIVLCYDLRFPELIRTMVLQGLEVLFVPARWPLVRDDAWRTLLKARAIENQIFVVGCNARGGEGGFSYAFDPLGAMVFTNRNAPRARMHAFTVNLDRRREAQKLHRTIDEAVVLRSARIPRVVTARRRPS